MGKRRKKFKLTSILTVRAARLNHTPVRVEVNMTRRLEFAFLQRVSMQDVHVFAVTRVKLAGVIGGCEERQCWIKTW